MMNERFRHFARLMSGALGAPWAFLAAVLVIVIWAITGPLFHFSNTWQLVINTGTTIVTFLMVFVIQNTQNRDAMATQLKLDELLRAVKQARTSLVDLEDMSDEDLAILQAEFQALHDRLADKQTQPEKDRPAPPTPNPAPTGRRPAAHSR